MAALLLCPLGTVSQAEAPALTTADAAFAQGKFDQARKTYAALIKADPKSIAPYPGLLQSLLRLDQWRDALRLAQTAVTVDPNRRMCVACWRGRKSGLESRCRLGYNHSIEKNKDRRG